MWEDCSWKEWIPSSWLALPLQSQGKNLFLLKWKETFFLLAMERIFSWCQSKMKSSVGHPTIFSSRLAISSLSDHNSCPGWKSSCPIGFREQVYSFLHPPHQAAVPWGWPSLRGEWLLGKCPCLGLRDLGFFAFPIFFSVPFAGLSYSLLVLKCFFPRIWTPFSTFLTSNSPICWSPSYPWLQTIYLRRWPPNLHLLF